MGAPREIVDSVESILGIYFSGVRHSARAAFILCDELVEMSCKLRARAENYRFDMGCSFHDAWNAVGVGLDPVVLGNAVQHNRSTRNMMQHNSAAATVDDQHCADAILGVVEVIDHCWPGTSDAMFKMWMQCAIRVVRLYSNCGSFSLQQRFEEAMGEEDWEAEKRYPKGSEVFITPGRRYHWGLLLRESPELVEQVLNRLEIP